MQTLLIETRPFSGNEIFQKLCPHVAVQQTMLELVLVTTQTTCNTMRRMLPDMTSTLAALSRAIPAPVSE